jgi:cytoskeletal protein CcmA (bactofilin family)
MLKTFMQPGSSSNARTDSNRTSHSTFGSTRAAESPRPAEATREETPAAAEKPARNDEGSKLIVGPNIKLKGSEITDCEILVVEGRVEASMNSRDIRIAEGGVFSGKAEIDVAEVRGTFEGELTARKRLVVYATGKVSGTIRYGALMVEEGGTISGNIASQEDGPTLVKVAEAPTPATPTAPVDEKTAEAEPSHSAAVFGRSQRRQA